MSRGLAPRRRLVAAIGGAVAAALTPALALGSPVMAAPAISATTAQAASTAATAATARW